MAQAVTVYKWDDPGAPQVVDGRPSEYLNVFKKCLVEGYAAKASLGWSLIDEETAAPHCAFMNDTSIGSGGAAMFSASNDNTGQKVVVRGVQDYIDKSNYNRSSPFHGFGYGSSGNDYINKNWILIGTGKAFWFFCYSNKTMEKNYTGTRSSVAFFMGDINSLIPNDPAPFICIGGIKDSTSTSWSHNLVYKMSDIDLSNISEIHPIDGSDSKKPFSVISLFHSSFNVNGKHTAEPNIRVLSPCYVLMGSSGSLLSSSPYQNNITPYVRGLIPGLFVASDAGYRDDVPPVIKEHNGESHYLIPSCNSHTTCAWINLELW